MRKLTMLLLTLLSFTGVVKAQEEDVKAKIGEECYATLQDAIDAAEDGETVTLQEDVITSEIIVIDKAITLDGKTKTLTSTAGRAINVTGADGVKIKNLYIDAKGERGINIIQNATNVTINSVNAKAANYAVNVASSAPNAKVIIDSSHLTGLNVVNIAAAGAQVTVNYCTLVCNDQNKNENYAALMLGQEATNATITATNMTFEINGDSQKAMCSATNGTITIGGSQDDVNKSVAVIEYQNSYYYSFSSLEDAISYAKAGETVKLVNDVTASEIIVINKAITLDGNNKTLTSTAGRAINVTGANGATIQNIVIKANGERGINIIQNATNVTISDVDVSAKNYAVNAATSAPNTVISISDSELSGLNVVNIAAPGAQITVDGTTLNCNDQSDAEGYAALCLGQEADGASIRATDVTFNITCDEATPSHKAKCNVATGSITIGGSEDEVKKAVAVVEYLPGPYYYAFSSLQAAFDKAKEGETVKLVNDVVVDEAVKINKLVTLDFNGFKITPADNFSASAFEVTGELCFKNKAEGSIADGLIYYIINDADYKAEAGKTFNLTENKEGVSIAYKRTFSHDGWQVLYVPFDIPVSLTQDKFEVYSITGISDVVELEQVTNGTLTLNAHTPYIIKVHADKVNEELYISGAAATTLYKPADEPYTATYGDYTITGTYTSKAIEAGQQYVLTNGEWCQLSEAAVTNEQNILGAFRVYLTANGASNASVLRNVINGENATAIDELKATENVNGVIYDLSGRRVEKAVKGVFIVNGKVVVK